MSPIKNKRKVLVMASGGGTTFEAIVNYTRENPECSFEVVGLVVTSQKAGAIKRAKNLSIPVVVVSHRLDSSKDFYKEVQNLSEKWTVDVIALAGFLQLVRDPLLHTYSGKILNTHPSLLPHFGGKGMYGDFVHQAVIRSGHKESGVTIHVINENYDEGRTLAVKTVPVHESDDYISLSERVRAEERQLYPQIIDEFCRSL